MSVPVAATRSIACILLLFIVIPSPQSRGERVDQRKWRPRLLESHSFRKKGRAPCKAMSFDASFQFLDQYRPGNR